MSVSTTSTSRPRRAPGSGLNAPTGNTIAAAEHTLALLYGIARRTAAADASVRRGEWQRAQFTGLELRGRTLGIVGLGKIGQAIAVRARAMEMTVLGVDPFISAVLERQGYLVTEAADGGEALEKAKADTLDLILLDLQMPVRTGYEVLGELRQDPRYAGLPVIALTASAMPGDREKALAAGFTAYIAKPVALAHLRAEVQRLLHADVSPPVDGAH